MNSETKGFLSGALKSTEHDLGVARGKIEHHEGEARMWAEKAVRLKLLAEGLTECFAEAVANG